MRLDGWARLVTSTVRTRIPDVRATQRGTTITWTLGNHTAVLDAVLGTWWLRFYKSERLNGPRIYYEQHDAHSAHVAASNIVTHFDLRWCRGIDHEPYTEVEMKRIEG